MSRSPAGDVSTCGAAPREARRDTRRASSGTTADEGLGNQAIQRAARGGGHCSGCEAKAKRYGVQAKCNDCTRGTEPAKPASATLASASDRLPHRERIQDAFGRHDVSAVRTVVGGEARGKNDELEARAFTTGDRIGFRDSPDLWLAAHEAAHVVQQRDGMDATSSPSRDTWETHADSVADAVVAGRSAEPLLDQMPADAPAVQLDDDKQKKTFPDETQEHFEQRVKDLAVARLTQNIATLGQWSGYVQAMNAFQLQTQLESARVMDWATTAMNMSGGDRKFEELVGTEDWGMRSYLDQQLSAGSTYRDRVAGFEDLLRSHSFGYQPTPSVTEKLQIQVGDLSEDDLPKREWVPADPRYEFYRDTLERKDRGDIHSGCQYCHEINWDWGMTAEKYGDPLPKGNLLTDSTFLSRKADFAKFFDLPGMTKKAAPDASDEEAKKALIAFLESDNQAGATPQQQPAAQPAADAGQNPYLPAIDVPATVTVPPPRSDLCGSLPEAPAGAPSPHLESWGPNSAIVAGIIARVNAVLTPLGPRGYRVLTNDSFDALWSMTPDNVEEVRSQILTQITARINDYTTLRGEIPGAPYHELCPIVDELLPSTSEEVRFTAINDIANMRFLETITTAFELVLLGLSFMFPPAAIVTVPASIALGLVRTGIGIDQVRQGDQWSKGIGAGIYSPEQEAQAPGLKTRGIINIVAGLFSSVTGAAALGKAAEAPEALVNVIETPTGLVITHKLYPGCAIVVEGNAISAINESGEVVASGIITPQGVVWNPGAGAADAAGGSTAIVPYGQTAIVPYGQGPSAFPFPGFEPPAPTSFGPPVALGPVVNPPYLPGYGPPAPQLGPGPQPYGLLPPATDVPVAVAKPVFPANEFPSTDPTWQQWPPPEPAKTKPAWNQPGGARWRFDRYRYQKWLESGKASTPPADLKPPQKYFDEHVAPKAAGQSPGEMGSPAHKALVLDVRGSNGIGTQTMGLQRPDAVGRIDQALTIPGSGLTVVPTKGGRVLYEADNFFKDGSQIVSEGREQVRQFRKDNPDATIVVQDVANPKNTIIYEPGTQPPPGGPLPAKTPNKVPVQ